MKNLHARWNWFRLRISIRFIKMNVCFDCFLEISIWFDWCLFQEENDWKDWEWNAHLPCLGEPSICFPLGNGGAYTLNNWKTDGRVDVPIECIFIISYWCYWDPIINTKIYCEIIGWRRTRCSTWKHSNHQFNIVIPFSLKQHVWISSFYSSI